MNFFGHAAVACQIDPDPRFVLGSMLPDLASMGRVRLSEVEEPRVADGVSCHHRTDHVFHGAPTFRELCARGERELEALGVGRGTAAAVAHVGVEMLLDGLLLAREPVADAYQAAIALEADFGIRLRKGELSSLRRVRSRLREIGLPTDYRSPARVALRLRQVLEGRPRLAMQAGDEDRVIPWLATSRERLVPLAGPLVEEVTRAVRVG